MRLHSSNWALKKDAAVTSSATSLDAPARVLLVAGQHPDWATPLQPNLKSVIKAHAIVADSPCQIDSLPWRLALPRPWHPLPYGRLNSTACTIPFSLSPQTRGDGKCAPKNKQTVWVVSKTLICTSRPATGDGSER